MNFSILPQDLQIFKRLPTDLHRFIYHFIYDEVKIYYWLEKYSLERTLRYMQPNVNGVELLKMYYVHTQTVEDMSNKFRDYFTRHRKRLRDGAGSLISWEWIWDDDYTNYDDVISDFTQYILEHCDNKKNMHGFYKYFGTLIILYEQQLDCSRRNRTMRRIGKRNNKNLRITEKQNKA